MQALGFELDKDLICCDCYKKGLDTSAFADLIVRVIRPKRVLSTALCPQCHLEYGRKQARESAIKIKNKYFF